jgi:hypothetical protein
VTVSTIVANRSRSPASGEAVTIISGLTVVCAAAFPHAEAIPAKLTNNTRMINPE